MISKLSISSPTLTSAPTRSGAAKQARPAGHLPAGSEVSSDSARVRLPEMKALETPKSAVRTLVSGLGYVEFPQLSPDGKTLVFNVVGNYATSQMMTVDPKGNKKPRALDTGEKITPESIGAYLSEHEGSIREQATWTKQGDLLYRSNEKGPFAIGLHDFESHTDRLLVADPNLNMKHPVQLENGEIVCYGGPPGKEHPTTDLYSNLFIADPSSGATRQLTHSQGEFAYKHPAPMNGKIVAHKEDKSKGGESDLILVDPKSGKETPLTQTPGSDERHPFYNSEVDLLVYHRKENSDKNLVLSTPDGTRTAQLTFYGRPAQSPCWSKDGREIYFVKKGEPPQEGQPFYTRQAEIRAIDVKNALKDLCSQAKKRLQKLEKKNADREVLDAAITDLENYRYFLRRYR